MPAPLFQYAVHHPVTGARMGTLNVREPKWSETVNGSGTFTCKVTVPGDSDQISLIRRLTDPLRAAVYVVQPDRYRLAWSGPILARKWSGDTNTLEITAMDWRSWLYSVVFGPVPNGSGTNTFTYGNTEQLALARAVFMRSMDEGSGSNGLPPLSAPAVPSSGVNRSSFRVSGMDFKSVANYLDDLANLDRGFEWDLVGTFNSYGVARLQLQTYFPQQGGVVSGLRFSKTANGGNILKTGDIDYDASAAARRVWAVGDGPNAESTPWAQDADPELAFSSVLRTDAVTQYQGSLTRADLASYARDERRYRADTVAAMPFEVRMDSPDMFGYGKGDRCQITIKDRFVDLNVTKCRIISREFDPDNNIVALTVNLNDLKLPDVDGGGSV